MSRVAVRCQDRCQISIKSTIGIEAKTMNPGDTWVHEEPMVGLEPTTGGLQNRCSTTELHRLTRGLYCLGVSVVKRFGIWPRLSTINKVCSYNSLDPASTIWDNSS